MKQGSSTFLVPTQSLSRSHLNSLSVSLRPFFKSLSARKQLNILQIFLLLNAVYIFWHKPLSVRNKWDREFQLKLKIHGQLIFLFAHWEEWLKWLDICLATEKSFTDSLPEFQYNFKQILKC